MINKWIDSTSAQYCTNKSSATINRLIAKHKNDKNIIKIENNKPLINSEFLQTKYQFINDNQMNANDNLVHQKDFAELTLKKQDKDIINKLLESQQTPFLRLSVFWVTVGFSILIVCIIVTGWLYRKELVNNNKSRINDLKQEYSVQIEAQKTELANQRARNEDLKNQYAMVINEIKSSNQKLASVQEKQITELSKKLEDAEIAHIMALKNTDVLHVKYNDKIEKLEAKIKELGAGE